MAASENIQPDQFIEVFHSSRDETPPHLMDSTQYAEVIKNTRLGGANPKGDLVFAGTSDAAEGRYRPVVHRYAIPKSMVRPEIWGDDLSEPHQTPYEAYGQMPNPQLFEAFPAQTDLATPTDVVQYRNAVEDEGSISYIMHKNAIKSGKIKYLGKYRTGHDLDGR